MYNHKEYFLSKSYFCNFFEAFCFLFVDANSAMLAGHKSHLLPDDIRKILFEEHFAPFLEKIAFLCPKEKDIKIIMEYSYFIHSVEPLLFILRIMLKFSHYISAKSFMKSHLSYFYSIIESKNENLILTVILLLHQFGDSELHLHMNRISSIVEPSMFLFQSLLIEFSGNYQNLFSSLCTLSLRMSDVEKSVVASVLGSYAESLSNINLSDSWFITPVLLMHHVPFDNAKSVCLFLSFMLVISPNFTADFSSVIFLLMSTGLQRRYEYIGVILQTLGSRIAKPNQSVYIRIAFYSLFYDMNPPTHSKQLLALFSSSPFEAKYDESKKSNESILTLDDIIGLKHKSI